MQFAKLENGSIYYAPRPLVVGDAHVFTNDPATHLALGYKELVLVPEPEAQEGYYNTFDWVETETRIVQTWRQEPMPEPEPEPAQTTETDAALAEMGVQVYE